MQRRASNVIGIVAAVVVGVGGLAGGIAPARAESELEPDPDAPMYRCGKPRGGKLVISFKPEVELKDLAAWAMGFSCKRVVYSASLAARAAKVVMLTPGEVTPREAWRIFQGALEAMGLTTVTKGDTLQIIESSAAKEQAIAITKRFPEGGGEVVRLLYRPEHVGVEDLQQALELVKSKNGAVAPLPKLGVVLVTDDAGHVARMKTLVRELDRPAAGDGVFAIPVHHVDPTQLVETLQKLVEGTRTSTPGAASGGPGGGGGGGSGGAVAPRPADRTGPRLVAAPRVRAVFVVGSAAEYLRIRALAQALDLDVGDAARIQAIKLRHTSAKEVATTLTTLVGSGTPAATGALPRSANPNAPPIGPAPAGEAALSGPVKFAADEGSNSLLVMAAPHDALAVRALVEELDTPRRQVYIEALVLEVEQGSTRELGVSAHGGKADANGDAALVGSFQSEGLSTIEAGKSLAGGGLVGGVLGKPLTGMLGELLGTTIPSFGLLIRAAAHHSRLDVLASPHVMTLDNKPATISVGANIPYKGSTGGTTPTGVTLEPQIERQKVALSLAITPHVAAAPTPGEADVIRLDVKLDSYLLGQEDYGGLGPSWKERTIDTSVILRDQESVVLGGLVDERIEESTDSVPILGDIPLLGRLFRSTRKIRQKSNLLVVLTPHVIDDSVAGRAILQRRMRERDEFLSSTLDLERRVLQPGVDYRKRRGVIAEIDAAVKKVDRERVELAAARARLQPPEGRIDEVDASDSVAPEPGPTAPQLAPPASPAPASPSSASPSSASPPTSPLPP